MLPCRREWKPYTQDHTLENMRIASDYGSAKASVRECPQARWGVVILYLAVTKESG